MGRVATRTQLEPAQHRDLHFGVSGEDTEESEKKLSTGRDGRTVQPCGSAPIVPPGPSSAAILSGTGGPCEHDDSGDITNKFNPSTHDSSLAPAQTDDSTYARLVKTAKHHAYCCWLFTASDLKTIAVPCTAFGVFSARAAPALHILPQPSWLEVLSRIHLVFFWTWTNLLPFDIDNQMQPESIDEDAVNKPWRVLPSKMMDVEHARRLKTSMYVAAVALSVFLGSLPQCLSLVALGFWYNWKGGADCNFVVRNIINAFGYTCFASGAMEIALPSVLTLLPDSPLRRWELVTALVVLTTVHSQDMPDQEGDSQRNRHTVPLVIGDGPARWSIAIAVVFWSIFCPYFWSVNYIARFLFVAIGLRIAFRTLMKQQVRQDKQTFRLWNLWIFCLFALPLCKTLFN